MALVGTNGAGKTIWLRTMVSLQKPVMGENLFAGQDIRRLQVTDICRQVGFLPQDPNALLFADQVQNELEITLRHLNLPIDQDRITQTLMQLDLQGCATVYPRDLCSGERQRVALATLMVTRHACLLLDEPTRGLDPHMKNDLGPLLQRLASQGAGILLVTHDVELVARVADRIVVIKSGRIIAQGKPYPVLRDHSEFSP